MRTTISRRSVVYLVLFLAVFATALESCKKTDVPRGSLPETESNANPSVSALRHTKQYPADVATSWFRLLTDIVKTRPYPNPAALRIFSYGGVALYESVVPGMPSYQSIYKYLTSNTIEVDHKKDYYWPACANAAIARISSRIFQNYANPNLTQIQALEASLNASFLSEASPEQLQLSNEFGRYVGEVIYQWSTTDGTLNSNGTLAGCPPYIPLGGAGNWVPTPSNFLPAAGACQGSLRTFIPNINHIVLPGPHPVYSTDPESEFYQAANEVYTSNQTISQDMVRVLNNWRDISGSNYNPPSHTLRVVTEIIIKEKLNLEDASVLFAKQTMAASDAIGAAVGAKFHYALLRPVTYIRGAMGHSTWNSTAPAPAHPSYPDELSATASTVAILENYFGTNYALIDSSHKSLYGVFNYSSLNDFLLDIGEARTQGGVTFRFCADAGVVQGRAVGQLMDGLPFKK